MSRAAVSALPRARRLRVWLAIGLLLAVPLTALSLAVVNFLDASDTSATAEREAATLAQLQRRLGVSAAATPAPPVDAAAIYLKGGTPALARAELQRLVVDAAETNGGRIVEAQDDQPDQIDLANGGRVRLRLTFEAKNEALLAILHAVETGLPLLTVEKIEIRKLDASEAADPNDPSLRVSLVVVGAGRFVAG